MAKSKLSSGGPRRVKGLSAAEDACLSIPAQDASAQMFRSLADHSQEFIGMCDLAFKPFYVNEAGMKLVGLDTLEEACAVKVQDFFFPEDQRYITEDFFPKVLREGHAEVEIRFRHFKTGAALWMIYNVFQVSDAEGRVNGYATVSRNITERKQAEEALQSVALVPAENPLPVLRMDGGGKLLFANRSAEGLLAGWGCAVGDRVPEAERAVRKALEAGSAQEWEIAASGRVLSFVLMPIRERGYVNLYGRDITEQKRAQAELRKSEERYHGLFEDDLTGDFICTPEGRIELCNPAFARIFGFPSSTEAVGTNMRDLYLEPQERGALVERVKRDRKVEHFEGWRKRRDGTPIHIVENLVAHFDDRGELVEIKGYIYEDTNRERAEEAVRERAEELRAVLDTAPVAVWIAQDRECRVITGNAYADELIMGTARGGNISRSASPGEAAVTYRVFRDGVELGPEGLPAQRATATGRPVPAFEMELVFPDGRKLNLMAGAVPLFDGQGKVRGAIVAGLDVTPLKRAQEELRLAEERARFALEAGRMGTWDRIMPNGPTVWNDAHYRILGYDPAQITASKEAWEARVHPEDLPVFHRKISAVLDHGGDFDEELRIVWPGGEVRRVELRGAIQCDSTGQPKRSCGVVLDLTERRNQEQALRESERRFATLVERAPVGIFETDAQGECIFVNEYWQALAGLSAREAAGKGWILGVHPDDRERVGAEWYSAAEGQREFSSEYRFQRPDGKVSWVLASAKPVRDGASAVVRYLGTLLDITERKHVEEALRHAMQEKTLILDNVNAAIAFHDAENNFIWANKTYLDAVGVPVSELRGRKCYACWGLDRVCVNCPVALAIETGQPQTGELAPDNQPHWRADQGAWIVRAAPVKDSSGKLIGVIEVAHDITERKRAEEALQQSEERLRLATESARIGTWEVDLRTSSREGEQLKYSKLIGPMFGEAEGFEHPTMEAWANQLHPEDKDRVVAAFEAAVRGEREYETEFRAVWPDGTLRWILTHGAVLRDSAARPVRAIGIAMDITERKWAEEALRESEEHFRSITDTTPVIMWMTDANGVMEFVNRAYCEFFGVTLEQLARPGGWQPLIHPEDAEAYVGAYMEALRTRSEFRSETRVQRADGQWRWIQSYGSPRFDDKGEFLGMAGSSPDITERKEFQAELERLVAERTSRLKELVGELEHFSYTITHDLKSPLRGMRGFAELAGEMCGEGEYDRTAEFLGRISTAAARMEQLIADALSYSRAVRQELPLDNVDSGALLRGMLDTYPELQSEKARIRVDGRLPVVLANEAGLTQVFSNLLGNAVKFVKPGESPEIRVWAEQRDGRARIWVEDKGIGIAKEMLPRMFEMFTHGSKDYEGTGIGLALVRKVAQRMGARVGVKSEAGKGSRFWIELEEGGPG